ncbi:MAG TPA: WD40 repeat domain-containing protein, partial [Sphingobacteriaceae bacterium]|nr:WD40 repeat domain-containing protein [Sphingobacteriaceae bacterium]
KREFVPHMFAIYSMEFHPNLPVFATASRDKSVKIWSAEDFRLLKSLSIEKGWEAHRLSVNALTWHPNGDQLFTTGDDKVIMVWDVKK